MFVPDEEEFDKYNEDVERVERIGADKHPGARKVRNRSAFHAVFLSIIYTHSNRNVSNPKTEELWSKIVLWAWWPTGRCRAS